MGEFLTPLDLVIFFALLVFAMAVGLIAGRKEETSEDYFLAGRKIPWWGVAGSIFGSNVSANHLVGMMGVGFTVGFAQSHFELGAIAGLMLLCYGFLPVYRKLNVYTLSEYLGRRYDDRSRIAYAIIMVLIMAVVQMVPALYIGSRTICVLLGDDAMVTEAADTEANDKETTEPESRAETGTKTRPKVNRTYYAIFVIALAVISASYTVFGGLKAVVWTDVIQSVLLLVAGIIVAILAFDMLGGWTRMMELDKAGEGRMTLYQPSNDPKLPWTGVLTGLMFMHFYYWGTNQFIVQRALGARSDREARLGIVAAGFLKLLIPFFSIAVGVAAIYLFKQEIPHQQVDSDAVFPELVKLVVPIGVGIIGLVAAGVIGAILSSIDSMMNSAATIVTVDIYKRYINPDASEKRMILVGRLTIVAFVTIAALLGIFVVDPDSDKDFFLVIADYSGYLTPGLLVAFFMGMFWRRGTPTAGFVSIIGCVVFSFAVQYVYDNYIGVHPAAADVFGSQLNFFHRVVCVILLCILLYVIVSLLGKPDPKKSRLTWTDLGGHETTALRNLATAILVSVGVFILLAVLMNQGILSPPVAAVLGGTWTFVMFLGGIMISSRNSERTSDLAVLLADDRLWAGLLCSLAVFMMFYFA